MIHLGGNLRSDGFFYINLMIIDVIAMVEYIFKIFV